ncbi:leucine-rich PPR motif-containing protein, mitochondrial isoform X2 [Condylostylus longicornis]|nr:leucine-rich PPR motif-containing protein, mitochondrial isoform X2 [Condylostylus longicornis]XP_055388593.1 leucine-rich PPR motif-containing protein, mitochondrial isoform X2 [Condylostylus longicornis]XP_055388598.1 leucine-rich PPR motif-containing protein, mitochondrial isoform X2 [Condylostylus longicornis]XP_055388599.1 leucine-rich PPR motif-containing protein, mitochondrial isoform X2 [Condylostylus longicornis]XP_055388604.1 leucine-rich PPR motif-containing protein, mitochondrial
MSRILLSTLLRHLKSYGLNPYSNRAHHYIQMNYAYNLRSKNVLDMQNKLISPFHNSLRRNYAANLDKKEDLKSFDDYFKDLSSYYLTQGYVNYELLGKVINSLNSTRLSEEQSNFLLESINGLYTISPEQRMKSFRQLWEYFKTNNYLNQEKILIALKVFQNNKIDLHEAKIYLNDFKDLKKDLGIYEELVHLACESGDIEKAAAEVLAEMRENNLPLTHKIFNSLIAGHAKNGNITGCESVLDTMNAANLEPSKDTFFELLIAYINNKLEKKAESLLDKILHVLTTDQILMLVKSAASTSSPELARLIKKLLEDAGNITDLPMNLRSVCVEFIYADKVDSAFLILDSFPNPNNENSDTDKFGQFFVFELLKSGQYSDEKCIEICRKLIESGKNERALHIACEVVLRRNCQKAETYLKALSNVEKLRPHYFWPLLNHNFKKRGEMGVFETLKLMSTLLVQADYDTLRHHCFPRLSIIFKNIDEAAKFLEQTGLKSSIFLPPLCSYLIIQQKPNDVIKLINLYPSKIDTTELIQPLVDLGINMKINKRYVEYSKIIKNLITKSENKNTDLAGQVLTEMWFNSRFRKNTTGFFDIVKQFEVQDVKISKAAFDLLHSQIMKSEEVEKSENIIKKLKQMSENQLSLNFTEPSDSITNHPRDMSLEQLECHLVELEQKKLNTRGVLRRLLQVYVRENQLEKALEIKAKCENLNVHNSPGMLASIFDLNIKLKNLSGAKNCLQNIRKKYPGFLVDEHKIIDLAALMVEKDKLDEAENLIIERASTTKVVGGEYVHKNLWNLLTQVAYYSSRHHSDENKNLTKDFFLLLKKNKFCQPRNVLLGPIIREYLLKNRIIEAVQEFKYIAENFKKTPLQLELMSNLIKIGNSKEESESLNISQEKAKSLLQDVVTSTSKIHGSINCNGTLLLAVCESGNENQLRKLLIDPEFQFNAELLSKNIEHLNANGRIENILKLAKASRGVRHNLSEQQLYKMLLNEFVKNNNYESAINLFNKLESDDEFKISTDFMNTLVDLLKLNKIEVPSNVALRAQLKI